VWTSAIYFTRRRAVLNEVVMALIIKAKAGLFESRLTLTQNEKITKVLIFFSIKMVFTVYVLYSLRLFKLKTEGKTI